VKRKGVTDKHGNLNEKGGKEQRPDVVARACGDRDVLCCEDGNVKLIGEEAKIPVVKLIDERWYLQQRTKHFVKLL
jgi:hypothetical protein